MKAEKQVDVVICVVASKKVFDQKPLISAINCVGCIKVEGEMDKLAMEEADNFRVGNKALPLEEELDSKVGCRILQSDRFLDLQVLLETFKQASLIKAV